MQNTSAGMSKVSIAMLLMLAIRSIVNMDISSVMFVCSGPDFVTSLLLLFVVIF